MPGVLSSISFTILSGATASDEKDLGPWRLVGFVMPAAVTGATISFKSRLTTSGTSVAVVDSAGASITFAGTASQGKWVALADTVTYTGTLGLTTLVSASAEGADRTITAIVAQR